MAGSTEAHIATWPLPGPAAASLPALTPSQAVPCEKLGSAVASGADLSLITGESGTGKTLVLQHLHATLERDNLRVCAIEHPAMGFDELMRECLKTLGIDDTGDEHPEIVLERIEGRVVLSIDEADALPSDVLKRVSRCPERAREHGGSLQIVLCGRPILKSNLAEIGCLGRAGHVSRLRALDASEVTDFVCQQVLDSGRKFTYEARALIAEYSQGLSGRIIAICQNADFLAEEEELEEIGATLIEQIALEHAFDRLDGAGDNTRKSVIEAFDERMQSERAPIKYSELPIEDFSQSNWHLPKLSDSELAGGRQQSQPRKASPDPPPTLLFARSSKTEDVPMLGTLSPEAANRSFESDDPSDVELKATPVPHSAPPRTPPERLHEREQHRSGAQDMPAHGLEHARPGKRGTSWIWVLSLFLLSLVLSSAWLQWNERWEEISRSDQVAPQVATVSDPQQRPPSMASTTSAATTTTNNQPTSALPPVAEVGGKQERAGHDSGEFSSKRVGELDRVLDGLVEASPFTEKLPVEESVTVANANSAIDYRANANSPNASTRTDDLKRTPTDTPMPTSPVAGHTSITLQAKVDTDDHTGIYDAANSTDKIDLVQSQTRDDILRCTFGADVRTAQVHYPNSASKLPCEVWYVRNAAQSEPPRTLWRAEHDAAYCTTKLDDLQRRLINGGWSCARTQ